MSKYTLFKLFSLFRKFGGIRLLRAYVKLGVGKTVLKEIIHGVRSRQSADKVFYRFQPVVLEAIKKKYSNCIRDIIKEYKNSLVEKDKCSIIWCCWLQGYEKSPAIVKACIQSWRNHIRGKEIRFIDESNLSQYVSFPAYIDYRWRKKQIPPALYADLIRLELLIKYGGTWIDTTVLCTGPNFPKEYLDTDLFLFQYSKPQSSHFCGISNWLITSCSHHEILLTLRDMLYAYWKDFDCVLEYFIFHRFFEMIVAEKPDMIASMPYGYSPNSQVLHHHWGEPFDEKKWEKVTTRVAFHKLAHQYTDSLENGNTFYNHILHLYSPQ